MNRCLAGWVALFSAVGIASTPLQASLDEMVRGADHLLVGRIVAVDMIDGRGNPLTDDDAMTGPGISNVIRLHVAVDEVLISSVADVPRLLQIPLDQHMHYRLGAIRQAHAKPSAPFLVLLKGSGFEPILPGLFGRALDEKAEALRLHAQYHPARP